LVKLTVYYQGLLVLRLVQVLQEIMEQAYPIQHILLADDDMDHALIFGKVLKKEYPSIDVSYVRDGEHLLSFLRQNTVDLLFLDLNMPCKSGYECLQEIRRDPALKELPIIVYSSSAHLSDIQKSFIHRADFYVVKPFNSEHLKTALQTILSLNWKQNPMRYYYFINNRFVPFTATA
jgi:CheY-like chemotaxis protein